MYPYSTALIVVIVGRGRFGLGGNLSYGSLYPNDPLAILGQIDLLVEKLTEREAENG